MKTKKESNREEKLITFVVGFFSVAKLLEYPFPGEMGGGKGGRNGTQRKTKKVYEKQIPEA
ncbi:MAG: hypothetical protein Q4D76_16805 [Oscillospiraceae bacterium]|nr:hypothetical protein [Oscillospiraceae bacterium]